MGPALQEISDTQGKRVRVKDHKAYDTIHVGVALTTERARSPGSPLAVSGCRANNQAWRACLSPCAHGQLNSARRSIFHAFPTTHSKGTRGEEAAELSPPLITYTIPPTTSFAFLFSSLIPTVYRPAASTARQFSPPVFSAPSPHKFFILSSCSRSYASAPKKKKMPPKKAVVEEKLLLGRPGNSLKSGIVSERPVLLSTSSHMLTVTARSALPTLVNPLSSRPLPSARSVTLPTSPTPPSTLRRLASSSLTTATMTSARCTTPSRECPPT